MSAVTAMERRWRQRRGIHKLWREWHLHDAWAVQQHALYDRAQVRRKVYDDVYAKHVHLKTNEIDNQKPTQRQTHLAGDAKTLPLLHHTEIKEAMGA